LGFAFRLSLNNANLPLRPNTAKQVLRYPLSLRNVEDLLAERGIDISHETVRFWWNRFGPMFAGQIRKTRIAHMRGYPQWRWHLDEVFVKINGRLCYLWRPVDHEGEVLESVVTAKRDKAAALSFLKSIMKKYGRSQTVVSDGLCSYPSSDERARNCRSPRGWPSSQQSSREFASTISTARAGEAVSEHEDPTIEAPDPEVTLGKSGVYGGTYVKCPSTTFISFRLTIWRYWRAICCRRTGA
jgi:transposase-like protein